MRPAERKSFQGVTNIIRFNWHYYAISVAVIVSLLLLNPLLPASLAWIVTAVALLSAAGIVFSLAASHYIYDRSNLYNLDWLNFLPIPDTGKLVNIHAGFDETSALLRGKYPQADITVLDFYDPEKHTEISIERARKRYPPYPGTQRIQTHSIPVETDTVDAVFLILAAHEIRNPEERNVFFENIGKTLRKDGRIVVMEHLRDLPNFIAFNIGFFHFYSGRTWHRTFQSAGLQVEKEFKVNPFVSIFILRGYGATS